MKNLLKLTLVTAIGMTAFWACQKENVEKNTAEEITKSPTENRTPVDADEEPYGPDLIVTRAVNNMPVVSPSACGGGSAKQPTCGTQYTFTVDVTNIGNAPVTDYYELELDKITGNTVTNTFTSPTSTLAPGATHTFVIGPAPFGGCSGVFSRQTIIFTADVYDVIDEINETNNTARPYQYCGD
jgi:hypothetical protein